MIIIYNIVWFVDDDRDELYISNSEKIKTVSILTWILYLYNILYQTDEKNNL